ncbi:hypothetical protein VTN00DRAFT_5784 [Thermoascus crustaceus]|uniref:uncharacterized protein n=1 Tax=Thermoascus crustaceus TaxID=5088 RepID=UPI0037446C01
MDLPSFLLYVHCGASECSRLIFNSLSPRDIRSLRLTCKTIEYVASSYPFLTRIYISSHAADLEAFQEITSNPKLARHVEEIIWDDTTFNRMLLDFTMYKPLWNCPDRYMDHLKKAFNIWKELGLPKLPHLRKVELTRLPFESGATSWVVLRSPQTTPKSPAIKQWLSIPAYLRRYMSKPEVKWIWSSSQYQGNRADITQTFSPQYAYEAMSPAIVNFYDDWGNDNDDGYSIYAEEMLRCPAAPAPVYAPFRGLLLLIRALCQTETETTRLEEFRIVDHEGFGMPLSFFHDENPELERLGRVLQPCRRLFVDTDIDFDIEPRPKTADALIQTLSAPRNLESIHLKFDWIEFSKLLGEEPYSIRLPQLREVTIVSQRELNLAKFHQLLSWCCGLTGTGSERYRHEEEDQKEKIRPLNCLRLMSVSLSEDAGWRSILDDLKAKRRIQNYVKRLELHNIVDSELRREAKRFDETWFSWGDSVMEYLNGDGPFPLRTQTFWRSDT